MTKEDNLMFDRVRASFRSTRILKEEMQLFKYRKVFKKIVYESQAMQITKSFCIISCFYFFPSHKEKTTCKNLFYASVSVFGISTLLTDSNHHLDVFSVIIPCQNKQMSCVQLRATSLGLWSSLWASEGKSSLYSLDALPETLFTELNKMPIHRQ